MSTVLFVGMPVRYVPALRGFIEKFRSEFGAWEFNFVPRQGKEPSLLSRDVSEIAKLADRSGSAHVYGWASPSPENRKVAEYLRQFFRFRWFPPYLLAQVSRPDPQELLSVLKQTLVEEDLWSAQVKPQNLTSPLLLPALCFHCGAKDREMWRHALAFGDIENIRGAEKAIEVFSRCYYRRSADEGVKLSKWIDDADLKFNEAGERHAVAPVPRSWKFSYRVIDGFHYDVTHMHVRRFTLADANGPPRTAQSGEHLNVDPHGYIR